MQVRKSGRNKQSAETIDIFPPACITHAPRRVTKGRAAVLICPSGEGDFASLFLLDY